MENQQAARENSGQTFRRDMVSNRILVRVESELRVLIPRFLSNRRRDLELIETNLSEQNFERIREIGHDMKGVGGGYGFERITELGAAIEDAAKRRDLDALASLASQYRTYLSDVDVVYI